MILSEENNNKEPERQEQSSPPPETKEGASATDQEVNVEELKAKITELEQSVASLKDQLLRKAAEFENYKKRIENDFTALAKFSNEELIVQLLPILDDFTRSLKASKKRPDFESIYKGIELIYNKFLKILELQGVKEIESVGKPFDVYYHDALMEIPRDDVPHHTVLEEVEKGYTLHGKVIRHAKVILARQPDVGLVVALQPLEQPSAETSSGTDNTKVSEMKQSDPPDRSRAGSQQSADGEEKTK